ncbi:hypothetical protein SASPL_139100 [Salvia splendens]|uniref:Uncharacterized protein n=1 Tax=Salvia splendens TaxID=180675 RepID=A0A8X8ZFN7_SALSN|nr:hypothetical protein SASPL_139100 [Salvia splendens]
MASLTPNPIQFHFRNANSPSRRSIPPYLVVLSNLASSPEDSSKPARRISADSGPKARFIARRTESVSVRQLQRPLTEYMSLPASQYSVLDAERIERVDDNTFRCYVYRFKFFAFEVCPVLLVRVEEQPDGCSINLLSCKLEGSPIVVAQNDKFDASMENKISCDSPRSDSPVQKLTSNAVIEVSIEIPFAFRAIPTQSIESTGSQVLGQILKAMLPRFMSQVCKCDYFYFSSYLGTYSCAAKDWHSEFFLLIRKLKSLLLNNVQLVKDYQAWASGDTSRQPLGTGEI